MMVSSQEAKNNAAVRGYILRVLVTAMHHRIPVRSLSKKLVGSGLITGHDIGTYLSYLHELEYIKFTNTEATPYNAYESDTVVILTVKGIRYIESNRIEPGIDL